jgi:hypothetical protein
MNLLNSQEQRFANENSLAPCTGMGQTDCCCRDDTGGGAALLHVRHQARFCQGDC